MASNDEKRLVDRKRDTKVKGVKPERETNGPYATEVEAYDQNAIKSPQSGASDPTVNEKPKA